MKTQRNRYILIFLTLGGLLLTRCAPKMYSGKVIYEIRQDNDERLTEQKTIYFNHEYVQDVPIDFISIPIKHAMPDNFHQFYLYLWKENRLLEYKNYLDREYIVERPSVLDSNSQFYPLKKKQKIMGYPCHSVLHVNEGDTAIVWYTEKIQAQYAPFYQYNPGAFVMKVEMTRTVPDWEKEFKLQEEGVIYKDSSHVMRYTHNDQLYERGEKDIEIVMEAISIQSIGSEDTLIFQHPSENIFTLAQFERVVSGYSLEQFSPGTQFPLPNTHEVAFKGAFPIRIPTIIYFWESESPSLDEDWATLQKLKTSFFPKRDLSIITITKESSEISKRLTANFLDATHITDASLLFDQYKVFLLPVAVVIDKNGQIVESVYSGNGQFEERLKQALQRTINNQ